MAKRSAVAQAIDNISDALPHLIRLPQRKAWIDYDEEADVLYIGLKRPQKATDTIFILVKSRQIEYTAAKFLDRETRFVRWFSAPRARFTNTTTAFLPARTRSPQFVSG